MSGLAHRIKWDTKAGEIARKAMSEGGYRLLNLGRRMMAWGKGRCSWCGANPGFSSSVSRKGLRCMGHNGRDCAREP